MKVTRVSGHPRWEVGGLESFLWLDIVVHECSLHISYRNQHQYHVNRQIKRQRMSYLVYHDKRSSKCRFDPSPRTVHSSSQRRCVDRESTGHPNTPWAQRSSGSVQGEKHTEVVPGHARSLLDWLDHDSLTYIHIWRRKRLKLTKIKRRGYGSVDYHSNLLFWIISFGYNVVPSRYNLLIDTRTNNQIIWF